MMPRLIATLLPPLVAVAACATANQAERQAAMPASSGTGVSDTTVNAQHAYTAADIHFMGGMIGHHAQAIVMAQWAPSHGASPSIQTLAARIINAQRDEIAAMEKWLRDRRQPLPKTSAHGIMMTMNGVE